MTAMVPLCAVLGVPFASDTMVGPTRVITYLGIETDSLAMAVRLPAEKLDAIHTLVASFQGRHKVRRRELLFNAAAGADLAWWQQFLNVWNSPAVIQDVPVSSHQMSLFTDASDLGFGCVYGNQWVFAG